MRPVQICFRKTAFAALLMAAPLVAKSQLALAADSTLICNLSAPREVVIEEQPTTIELNDTQSTVVVHFSAAHMVDPEGATGGADGRGSPNPAATIGPLQANFGANSITFSSSSGGEYSVGGAIYSAYAGSYVLNRITGTLVHRRPNESENSELTLWQSWACQAGQKKF
jgi:hypothetical protein